MQGVPAVPALSLCWEGSGCLRLTGWTAMAAPGVSKEEEEEQLREIFISSSV